MYYYSNQIVGALMADSLTHFLPAAVSVPFEFTILSHTKSRYLY